MLHFTYSYLISALEAIIIRWTITRHVWGRGGGLFSIFSRNVS